MIWGTPKSATRTASHICDISTQPLRCRGPASRGRSISTHIHSKKSVRVIFGYPTLVQKNHSLHTPIIDLSTNIPKYTSALQCFRPCSAPNGNTLTSAARGANKGLQGLEIHHKDQACLRPFPSKIFNICKFLTYLYLLLTSFS